MAGQLHPNSREQLASAAAGLAFKAAGVAVVAATPDGSTPRRFIKLLHAVVNTLQKHHEHLLPEAIKSLKVPQPLWKQFPVWSVCLHFKWKQDISICTYHAHLGFEHACMYDQAPQVCSSPL
jgi:hypothetical protein